MTTEMISPPCLTTEGGQPRRIGVEIEFTGISCEQTAALVQKLFGGRIDTIDPYRFEVADTRFGTFTIELDSQYAHPDGDDNNKITSGWDGIGRAVRESLESALNAVSSLWVPVEIVSPPIPLADLPELDVLVPALRQRGAEGSSDGLVYAFATQLNPEVPSLRAESVLAHFKAFLLLAEELRAETATDLLRRALPFASPFPKSYVRKVLDPEYQPDLPQLIGDYLEASPTRNREFDLLPLFLQLAPERVRAEVEDSLVKARPTFHYRMPDTRLSDPAWGLVVEWNRWVRVEFLAADPMALHHLCGICINERRNDRSGAMAEVIDAWRAERIVGR